MKTITNRLIGVIKFETKEKINNELFLSGDFGETTLANGIKFLLNQNQRKDIVDKIINNQYKIETITLQCQTTTQLINKNVIIKKIVCSNNYKGSNLFFKEINKCLS